MSSMVKDGVLSCSFIRQSETEVVPPQRTDTATATVFDLNSASYYLMLAKGKEF